MATLPGAAERWPAGETLGWPLLSLASDLFGFFGDKTSFVFFFLRGKMVKPAFLLFFFLRGKMVKPAFFVVFLGVKW